MPTITDIGIFPSIQNTVMVNDVTESTEFIFAASKLDQSIRVGARIQIKESIHVHAVDTVGMKESSPQKSSISTLVDDDPCETRKEISFQTGIFLLLWKSESVWTAC